jgi:hypothetical protein
MMTREMSADWIPRCPRRMMVGLHVPDYDQMPDFATLKKDMSLSDILEHVDPKAFVRDVKKAHVQAFWFYSKCHYGNAYYPSKVGHVHSALKGRDLFGELVEACLSEGVVPLCVYEFSDMRIPKDHPDWCHQIPNRPDFASADVTDAAQGARVGGPCLNGPYGEFAIEQTIEVMKQYPIRGYYVDFLGLFGSEKWICPYCNPKLKKVLGREFPGTANLTHDEYIRYVLWRLGENDRYAQRLRKAVKSLRPDVAFVHNFHGFWGAGDFQWFDFASRNSDFLTADHFQLRDGMLQMSWKLRAQASGSQPRPAEALLDSMVCTPGDFATPKGLDGYRAELWTARAANVATCCSIIIRPDGSFDRRIFALTEKIMAEHRAYEPWLKDMEPLAGVALVRSSHTLAFRPKETGETPLKELHHQYELEGWAQVLVAAHALWDMLDESQLTLGHLKRFKVLILPNVSCMDARQAAAIAAFVKQGGRLIATGDTSLFDLTGHSQGDFQLASVFGARFEADRDARSVELMIEETGLLPANEPWVSPVLRFSDGQLRVCPTAGAEALGKVGNQATSSFLANMVSSSDRAGLLHNRYGRGQCWYFAGKPGLQFRYYGQSNVKRLLKAILARAAEPGAPVRLEAPDTVELFAHRQKGKKHVVVNLVNCAWGVSRSAGGFINLEGKKGPSRFDDIETMPRLHEVKLFFKTDGRRKVKRVYRAPDGKNLPVKKVGDEAMVKLAGLGVHAMLVAEY